MLTAISDIISPPPMRDRTPVRKYSRPAGRCEGNWWRPITKREAHDIRLAAEKYDVAGKAFGDRKGPLGPVGLQIINYLTNLADARTGRLEPSIEYLMAKLRRSRDSIVTALKALRRHGFLDWLRRYVSTGRDHGPQVQQTSNAYRLSLPQRARRLLRGAPPLPDDFTEAKRARSAMLDAYKAQLSLAELPLFSGDADDPLTQALCRLGASIMKRESDHRTESPSKVIS